MSARRFMTDQSAMRAIGAAIAALADDPVPPDGFHAGEYHRLRAGRYRVAYVIEADLVTVLRVDRV
jgi:mRNA-degrading endonuclease RelE of RelBE toxin-antitoxin system